MKTKWSDCKNSCNVQIFTPSDQSVIFLLCYISKNILKLYDHLFLSLIMTPALCHISGTVPKNFKLLECTNKWRNSCSAGCFDKTSARSQKNSSNIQNTECSMQNLENTEEGMRRSKTSWYSKHHRHRMQSRQQQPRIPSQIYSRQRTLKLGTYFNIHKTTYKNSLQTKEADIHTAFTFT